MCQLGIYKGGNESCNFQSFGKGHSLGRAAIVKIYVSSIYSSVEWINDLLADHNDHK